MVEMRFRRVKGEAMFHLRNFVSDGASKRRVLGKVIFRKVSREGRIVVEKKKRFGRERRGFTKWVHFLKDARELEVRRQEAVSRMCLKQLAAVRRFFLLWRLGTPAEPMERGTRQA
jgi:hypothetical protein